LIVILVGLVAGLAAPDRRYRAMARGIGLYLLYVTRIGGDFMSGRFFTAPLLLATLVLCMTALRGRRVLVACGIGLALLCATPFAPFRNLHPKSALAFNLWGIADERLVYDKDCSWFGPSKTGRRPSPESRTTSVTLRGYWDRDHFVEELRKSGLIEADDRWPEGTEALIAAGRAMPVVLRGAVGYLAFFPRAQDPRVGLPCAQRTVARASACAAARPTDEVVRPQIVPALVAHRPLHSQGPPGYVGSLVTGENHVRDPDLARFLAVLWVVTRGNIFSKQRMKVIIELNLGRYDDLVAKYVARQASTDSPSSP
jgi:arabinofuranosyltransferase